MASSGKTANLNLTQFVAEDKPSWLTDYNSDMQKLDMGVSGANDSIMALAQRAKSAPVVHTLELCDGFSNHEDFVSNYFRQENSVVTVTWMVAKDNGHFTDLWERIAQLPLGFKPQGKIYTNASCSGQTTGPKAAAALLLEDGSLWTIANSADWANLTHGSMSFVASAAV